MTQYMHDVWQTDQGLPQNSVKAICQTRDGYLWLGTEEGLARFDGVRFTVFDKRSTPELLDKNIHCLREDREGSLWIGMYSGGLNRLKDGRFTSYTEKDGLTSGQVFAVYENRQGSLWIGTRGGLTRLEKGKLTPFPMDDGVRSILEDRAGALWIGTSKGLSRFEDGKVVASTAKELLTTIVYALQETRDGSLWIGTIGAGLARLRAGQLTRFTTREGLSSDVVMSLAEDRDGNLWIGTMGGLHRFRDGTLSLLTTAGGLSNDQVTAFSEDRERSLWIGTYGGGLNRLRDGKLTAYTSREGLASEMVRTIYEDRAGSIWFGAYGALDRLTSGGIVHYTKDDGLSDDQIQSVFEDRAGTLWVGTLTGGINRMARPEGEPRSRAARFTHLATKDGLPSDNVSSIRETADGSLWIGTDKGLGRLRDGAFTTYTTKDGMSDDSIAPMLVARDKSLWIGTDGGGLTRFVEGTFTRFTTKDGLSGDVINSLHEDSDGVLWVGTGGQGLNRIEHGKCTRITMAVGLYDDTVHAILEDEAGNLWMSCNRGIFRASRKELNAFAEGRIPRISCVSYGTADGMKTAECNGGQPAGWKTRDGRLWFPTIKGVVTIDPARIPTNELPPAVVIEEVLVDRTVLPRTAGSPIVLPPGKEKLEFHYTALSFRAPQKVKFKYRLDGFDRDWIDAGTERTAYYTNLPPRSYTFRVLACNDDGLWNTAGASLAFALKPQFHQTWWFYLLCALGVTSMAAAVHRARVEHLQARQRELVQVVDEKTNDLQAANRALREAQEKISRLLESSPAASESIPGWSRSVADEIAASIGARAIGIWEVDRDVVTALSASGLTPPSREELESLVSAVGQSFVASGEGMIVPVTGTSGELCGALVVSGGDVAWGETERHLVAGFAHQLGGALEMKKIRRKLAAAEEHRAATRREMHERGIATLQICPSCGRCYAHTTTACPDDGAPLDSPRPLPYVLLGRYRFVRVLGQGGMGLVLSAHDEKLGRDVAVKLIRPEHWSNAEVKQRFEREARTVARIQHPGVVALHDSGELDDGTAFIVMEQLVGCDLSLLLKAYGAGKPAQVARLVRQGCAALRAAHRAGVVHRDVKPENVFFVEDASGFRVKLLDFGLAKSMTLDKGLTQTGMLLGTPAYMAPEQVQGEDVDSRADVYSFAAVVYEALTGKQAVSGNDLGRVLVHVLNTTPAAVSSLVTGMPPDVDAAFESALAKDPARRLKDIELWGSSFVELLEVLPANGNPGWPISSGFLTNLRDSTIGKAPTLRVPK